MAIFSLECKDQFKRPNGLSNLIKICDVFGNWKVLFISRSVNLQLVFLLRFKKEIVDQLFVYILERVS
jgi:hypothetical protein